MVEAKTKIKEGVTSPMLSSTKSTATLDKSADPPTEDKKSNEKIQLISNANGKVKYSVMGSAFELPEQFELINMIGSGAYGVVVAVRNKYDDNKDALYAIKKIEKAFEHKVFA